MSSARIDGPDRRRSLAVDEDVQRITRLAQELQRNAIELEGQSRKLRDTLDALSVANEELDRKASEIASATELADAATARLARLQSITAALSNTVTPDDVADSVLREAMIALECEAAAVVLLPVGPGTGLSLLRESGPLDPLMLSFAGGTFDGCDGPYAEVIESKHSIYLESAEQVVIRYPTRA